VHPSPENHASFKPDMCTSCHKPALQESSAPIAAPAGATPVTPRAGQPTPAPAPAGIQAIPHDLAGRDNCLMCHNPEGNIKPAPKDHVGRANETCQMCHKPKG
jgi:hypothetical protein